MTAASPSIAVVVPTWRRPEALRRCLDALERQTRPAAQVLVVVRPEDADSRSVGAAPRRLPVELVTVSRPGQVAALQAGVTRARAKVVAITDDDTVPHPDWLERLGAHYAEASVGGVGGRDHVFHDGVPEAGEATVVGRLQWFGRVIGNHHLGIGPPRSVDVLKGANMSFRLAALAGVAFDGRLRGGGAQVHNDMALSLAVVNAGWRLVYDPAAGVDHHPAARFDRDVRDRVDALALENAVHNETLLVLEHIPPWMRLAYLTWAFAVGTARAPGVAQLPRLVARREPMFVVRTSATVRGRIAGIATWLGAGRR